MERIRQTPHLTLQGLEDEATSRGRRLTWQIHAPQWAAIQKAPFALEQGRSDLVSDLYCGLKNERSVWEHHCQATEVSYIASRYLLRRCWRQPSADGLASP